MSWDRYDVSHCRLWLMILKCQSCASATLNIWTGEAGEAFPERCFHLTVLKGFSEYAFQKILNIDLLVVRTGRKLQPVD